MFTNRLPLILAILIFILIYFLRLQQVIDSEVLDSEARTRRGGWESKLDLLVNQRKALDQRISQTIPSPQAQLLSGILLGQNKNLQGSLKLALRDTSTLHIVVASGQNLSMVAGFFLALSGLIKRKLAIALAFLAIIFYTLLTGADVPVLRAAIMVTLTFIAQICGRLRDAIWVLLMTAALMLLINPLWISNLSFQLSFMATLGLLVVVPILLKYLKFLPLIGQDLAVTIGAQLMVIPIIAQNFHQLSIVGIFANVLVGWTVPFIMILGSIMLAVSFISQFLAQVIALAVGVLLTYFVYIVYFFASMPFAWEYIGEQGVVIWIGYYLVLAGVLLALSNFKNEI